jgi:DNA-directed RNA polymerase subunit RPC12/RpoP
MSPDANLTCYRATCGGEFEHVGEDGTDTLYRCRECGSELSQSAVEQLADADDGPVADLASVLLAGGER